MSAHGGTEVADAPSLSLQVETLRIAIVAELSRAGLALPASDADALAETVMARALRLAVQWLEEGDGSGWGGDAGCGPA